MIPLRRTHLPVTLVLVAVTIIVMAPRVLSAQFGLLDDGVTLNVTEYLRHTPVAFLNLEAERGRFRPVYWLYYAVQEWVWGSTPQAFFMVQWAALTVTALAVAGAVEMATRSRLGGAAGGLAFAASAPVWENYYTLSKPEAPLVLWLACSTYCLFRAMWLVDLGHSSLRWLSASTFLVGLAYFTKETAVVMLPISLGLVALAVASRKSSEAQLVRPAATYGAANIIWFCVYILARWLTGTYMVDAGTDSSHYVMSPEQINRMIVEQLAWIARDFAYVVPLLATAAMSIPTQHCSAERARLLVIYGGLFAAGWLIVMLPWSSSLEYYLLPSALGLALVTGAAVALVVQKLRCGSVASKFKSGAILAMSAALCWIPLVNGVTTGRLQLAVDAANAELMHQLAQAAPPGATIALNLPDENEYMYETALHLNALYGRPDVHVSNVHALSSLVGAVIATPRMVNPPVQTPRIAVDESGTVQWFSELQTRAPSLQFSAHGERSVSFIHIALDAPLCSVFRSFKLVHGGKCGTPQPIVDARTFVYGWYVFQPVTG